MNEDAATRYRELTCGGVAGRELQYARHGEQGSNEHLDKLFLKRNCHFNKNQPFESPVSILQVYHYKYRLQLSDLSKCAASRRICRALSCWQRTSVSAMPVSKSRRVKTGYKAPGSHAAATAAEWTACSACWPVPAGCPGVSSSWEDPKAGARAAGSGGTSERTEMSHLAARH